MRKVFVSEDSLRNLYVEQGLTTYQIAEKLGFCQGTIWKRLHSYGIKPRSPRVPLDITKDQLADWYISKGFSTWEIEKRFGYSRGSVHRKLKEFGLSSRDIAVSHIRFPRSDFSGDLLEKAYLLGFRIGDLNVTRAGPKSKTITVKCASTKGGQLELFRTLFGTYGRILQGKPTREGRVNIQAGLNETFAFLLDKSPSNYTWAFDREETFFAFLAGFSDAEGSFYLSRGKAAFSLGNYDKEILSSIKTHLLRHGIETPSLRTDQRKGRMDKNGYMSKGNYTILSCTRKKYLLKLINILRPHLRHPDKILMAEKSIENIEKRNRIFGNLRMEK